MNAKEAVQQLQTSRSTLDYLVRTGKIKARKVEGSKRYDFDDADVFVVAQERAAKRANKPRRASAKLNKAAIYARVKDEASITELGTQLQGLKAKASELGTELEIECTDVVSDLSGDRPGLLRLIDAVVTYKVDTVVVTGPEGVSESIYPIVEYLCKRFQCTFATLEDNGNKKSE